MSPEAPGRFALGAADAATFWPWRPWPAFDPERIGGSVAVLPVCGLADWELGAPLDAEETLLLGILQTAAGALAPAPWLLTLPPLRFVAGRNGAAFALEPPLAQSVLAEWIQGILAAGVRRVVLLNSSPANEDICAVVARDIHVGTGAHLFCLHLSALGLDFDPIRSPDRAAIRRAVGGEFREAAARVAGLLGELRAWSPA